MQKTYIHPPPTHTHNCLLQGWGNGLVGRGRTEFVSPAPSGESWVYVVIKSTFPSNRSNLSIPHLVFLPVFYALVLNSPSPLSVASESTCVRLSSGPGKPLWGQVPKENPYWPSSSAEGGTSWAPTLSRAGILAALILCGLRHAVISSRTSGVQHPRDIQQTPSPSRCSLPWRLQLFHLLFHEPLWAVGVLNHRTLSPVQHYLK